MLGFCFTFLLLNYFGVLETKWDEDLLLLTAVVDEDNSDIGRFFQSANANNYSVEILGRRLFWKKNESSDGLIGFKINLLKQTLKKYRDRDDLIILYVECNNVIMMRKKDELLKEYKRMNASVVFSAEKYCYLGHGLCRLYPNLGNNKYNFLNPYGFIGRASYLYKLFNEYSVDDYDNIYLFYSSIILDDNVKKKYDIQLDLNGQMFQSLDGAYDELLVTYNETYPYLINKLFGTRPIVACISRRNKLFFSTLVELLLYVWNMNSFYDQCQKIDIHLMNTSSNYPEVMLAIFIEQPTPFLDLFFKRIANLNYPKSKLHFVGHIAANALSQYRFVEEFNDKYESQFRTFLWFDSIETENNARRLAFARCLQIRRCEFLFSVDGFVQLTYLNVIKDLISTNISLIAPLVISLNHGWYNFLTFIDDYSPIVKLSYKGIWRVNAIKYVYLIDRRMMIKYLDDGFERNLTTKCFDVDENRHMFAYVYNNATFGHLNSYDSYSTEHLHNDMYEIFSNSKDWKRRYLDRKFLQLLRHSKSVKDLDQPCPDVYWIPLFSKLFCKHLIEEIKHHQSHKENIANLNLSFNKAKNEIKFLDNWFTLLELYIFPIQKLLFTGLKYLPLMHNTVVKMYTLDYQRSNVPHFDDSSYSVKIVLNKMGLDYKGGGTKYIRYNCSVMNDRQGWAVISPGRVTHLHADYPLKHGTQFIIMSYVDV